jgi:hypothetical protein
MSSARTLLSQHLEKEAFESYPGARAGTSLSVIWPDQDKHVVLPYIHLLVIKRRHQEIVISYPFAEVRIAPGNPELSEKLVLALREFRVDKLYHGKDFAVAVLFHPPDPELELEEF